VRLYISGRKLFGQAVYELAKERGHEIVGVCSPAFRGEFTDIRLAFSSGDEWHDRLRMVAEKDDVPWMEAGNLRAETLPDGVDLIIAAHSFDFIGERTLRRAALGGVGYHPSLLPRHRGRDAIRWALHMGDPVTGGTVYWLSKHVDCGPIAAQSWCWIRPGDTPEKLWRRGLFPLGLRLFGRVLDDVDDNVLVRVPQVGAVATWEPSWDRPPLYRPDLLQLGTVAGFDIKVGEDALR
jgi:methionyl-tRNA formyltransferase